MNNIINLDGVYRSFGNQSVLENVNIVFPEKGLIGFLGPSGSGKTTLLNIVAGLDDGYFGKCFVLGRSLKDRRDLSSFRLKNIGYVFQNYSLIETESVLSNVYATIDAVSKGKRKLKERKCFDLLSYVGLKDKVKQNVATLSGGERQRVCLARALSTNPKILICDEPTGALDEKNAHNVFSLLKNVSKSILVIVASHDEELIGQYADEIIKVENRNIKRIVNQKSKNDTLDFTSLKLKKKKLIARLSSFFICKHALNLLKHKKLRSFICFSAIAVGFVGIGLSNYVSSCIESEVENVFSSIVSKNQIIVSQYDESLNPISNIYSASLNVVEDICSNYPDLVKDYGTSYLVDYDSFFCDRNYLCCNKGSKTIVLPSFSARSINDYLWIDSYQNLNYFPLFKSDLEPDEIILGLPYSDMVSFCYDLQILRNYQSLGEYIKQKDLHVIFKFANNNWSYEDEQIFKVVGIVSFQKPTIFHSNHRWNEEIFENFMRFPHSDYHNDSLPWIMNKAYYLSVTKSMSSLTTALRNNPYYDSLIFEPPSYQYEPTHCEYDTICSLNRLYVYEADKHSLSLRKIQELSNFPGVSSKVVTTNGSYFAYHSSLMIGFAQKLFITTNYDSAAQIIDSYSFVNKSDKDSDFDLPNHTLQGDYLKSALGGFKISSDFKNFNKAPPLSYDEVYVSDSLFEKLNKPNSLVVVGQISEEVIGESIHRDFRTAELKILGTIESNLETIFVKDYWTVDFFREYLGMSAFYLEPTGCVLTVERSYDEDVVISELSKSFPDLKFTSPYKSIESSISSTSDYLALVLGWASGISSVVSLLLFICVLLVTILENEKEASLLLRIGIQRSDVIRIYNTLSFDYILVAFVITSFSLIVCQIITQFYIADSFGTIIRGVTINRSPFIVVGFVSLSVYIISSLFVRLYFHRKSK